MTTVFVSGSRHLGRINDMIRDRIGNMIEQDFRIVVGDANGADRALQKNLADARYENVVVFCSGETCRNNIGKWDERHVPVDSRLKGRAFYTQKDMAMAAEADYGLVLWDGKSVGSIGNVLELLKREKSVVVYFAPEKRFFTLSSLNDAKALLERCDAESVSAISKKISLPPMLADIADAAQGTFILS